MVDVFNTSTGKSNATEVKGRQFVVSRTFARLHHRPDGQGPAHRGRGAQHLELNMPMLKRAVAYWADASTRLGTAADHTEIIRYAEMLAEEEP
jgi:hypothetical protein